MNKLNRINLFAQDLSYALQQIFENYATFKKVFFLL